MGKLDQADIWGGMLQAGDQQKRTPGRSVPGSKLAVWLEQRVCPSLGR